MFHDGELNAFINFISAFTRFFFNVCSSARSLSEWYILRFLILCVFYLLFYNVDTRLIVIYFSLSYTIFFSIVTCIRRSYEWFLSFVHRIAKASAKTLLLYSVSVSTALVYYSIWISARVPSLWSFVVSFAEASGAEQWNSSVRVLLSLSLSRRPKLFAFTQTLKVLRSGDGLQTGEERRRGEVFHEVKEGPEKWTTDQWSKAVVAMPQLKILSAKINPFY